MIYKMSFKTKVRNVLFGLGAFVPVLAILFVFFIVI
jgi:hypothetical protein